MSDEIISKSHNDIPFGDEDACETRGGTSRLVASWITSRGLTDAEAVDTCSRNVQSFTTFRASGLPRRELPAPDDDRMLNHRREPTEQRHARQLSVLKSDQSGEEAAGSALRRYENAVLRYQKPKARPKRQISRERRQQQRGNYSSSDESVARHKSKSTSSIDTQSVNNILDEYEDLDYRRSSDLSDVGSISVSNFEAVMMDQQKRQQQGRLKLSGAKVQVKSIPTRERVQPVLKVNQQTQVRQRSRDRQKDSSKGQQQQQQQQDTCCVSPSAMTDAIESGRSRMPEVLLRKGEVQKRVDEWLSQAHSQNFPLPREKPLTRSNSSAEKSQRRYRQDSRARSIDEARNRLNGGASSSYDDLTRVERKIERGRLERINVGVNTGRGAYKEYLAVRSKVKQQDHGGYGAQPSVASSRPGDSSPASRIPQRGPLGSSFRRAEAHPEERGTAESRIANLARTRNEFNHNRVIVNSSKVAEVSSVATSTATTTTTTTTSILPGRRPSLKRTGNGADQNCAAARSLVKEETTDARSPRGTGGLSKGCPLSAGVGLGDQGDPISPNKDGESRRPAAAASGPTPRPADKAAEAAACKSMEAPARCHPRDGLSRIAEPSGGESRRRFQVSSDARGEYRSHDQSRQEQPIYGLPVGARVRALQGQAESRGLRFRRHQVGEASVEARRPPAVLPRRDFDASSSQDGGSQERVAKAPIGAPSSSFKPNNRAYTAITSALQQQQQLNEQNAARSKVVVACEAAPPAGRIARYAPPDHVERIYERSLQPQVIHANDLESILRPSLQVSPYGEKVGAPRSDREPLVKETSTAHESEAFAIGESRHEHLETIVEDDRKSEGSICKYPEIGLKQCLKVQQSLPNGRSKESADRRKDGSSIYTKWDQQQQQVVLNEPARTFATFQSIPPGPANVKPSVQPRSTEMKESNEPAAIVESSAVDEDASREHQDQLVAIHSRENSNLSTATIPVDELESQRGSRFRTGNDPLRSRFQFNEKSQDRATEETAKDTDGAVVNEVLVKNLQFEQDLPENPLQQTKVDSNVQHVNFRSVLCDDYEKLKNKKVYITKEEMDHQRLIDMLKKGDFEMLKMVSNRNILYFLDW